MRIIIISLVYLFWSCNDAPETNSTVTMDSTENTFDSLTTDADIDTTMSPDDSNFDIQITGVAFLNTENISANFRLDGTNYTINPREIIQVDLEDETALLSFVGQTQPWQVNRYHKYILERQSNRWIVRRITQQ